MSVVNTELVWVRHTTTGGVGTVPVDALDAWIGRGWELTDPPAAIDPTDTRQVDGLDQAEPPANGDEAAEPTPEPAPAHRTTRTTPTAGDTSGTSNEEA